jgi:hypothetical protein
MSELPLLRAAAPPSPRALANVDPLWDAFRTAYNAALESTTREHARDDHVAGRAVQLLAPLLVTRETLPTTPRVHQGQPGVERTQASLNRRGRGLADKLLVAFAAEPRGLPGCLERAQRWDGFDWFRDRLEHHGFTRAIAWRLCLAFRRAGLLSSAPNRPYLDRRSVGVAQRLLAETGIRAQSVRDWEAALMLEGDSQFAAGAHAAKLDAEIVVAACARLAATNKSDPKPSRRLR